MNTNRKKIGLALGSGGIRGLAHIGVLRVLLQHNIPIDYIAGTSIGAWIGAFYAMDKNLQHVENLAMEYRSDKLRALIEPTLQGGMVKGKKVEKLLRTWLDDKTFSELALPLSIVTSDLLSGKEYVITSGDVAKAVQASIAIPLIFKPVQYDDALLVDGALLNPLPVNRAYEMGADYVIGVNVDLVESLPLHLQNTLSLRGTALRSFHLMRGQIYAVSTHASDVLISPRVPMQPLQAWKKYFGKENVDSIVRIGEEAALAQLPKIKALIE